LGVASSTQVPKDIAQQYHKWIAELLRAIPYPDGACGVAISIGAGLITLDLFDKSATCKALWDWLISGTVADLPRDSCGAATSCRMEVEQLIDALQTAKWSAMSAAGEDDENLTIIDFHTHASALLLQGALIHCSAVRR